MPDTFNFGVDPITCHAWNHDRSRKYFVVSKDNRLAYTILLVAFFSAQSIVSFAQSGVGRLPWLVP